MRQAVFSQAEWLKARDQPSAARRALPWVKVEKNYVFNGPGQ